MVLREYHHEGMFGEKSVSELTDQQLELLNLSQQYDVVQMAVSQYYGEDNDGVEREIPEDILPYPSKVWKWYERWKDDGKKVRNRPRDKNKDHVTFKPKVKPTTVFVDNESNADALAKWQSAKKAKNSR